MEKNRLINVALTKAKSRLNVWAERKSLKKRKKVGLILQSFLYEISLQNIMEKGEEVLSVYLSDLGVTKINIEKHLSKNQRRIYYRIKGWHENVGTRINVRTSALKSA